MVKKKFLEKDRHKRQQVKLYEIERRELLSISQDFTLPMIDRFQARLNLHLLPRDSSYTRVRNRCIETSRSRGVLRKFKISRITLRELMGTRAIPGIKKSSW